MVAIAKSWYVTASKGYRKLLGLENYVVGKETIAKIAPENWQQFQQFINQLKLLGHNDIRTTLNYTNVANTTI